MDPATISGVVGRLIARGYVRQSPDAQRRPPGAAGAHAGRPAAVPEMKAVGGRGLAPDAGAADAPPRPDALVRALAKIG